MVGSMDGRMGDGDWVVNRLAGWTDDCMDRGLERSVFYWKGGW